MINLILAGWDQFMTAMILVSECPEKLTCLANTSVSGYHVSNIENHVSKFLVSNIVNNKLVPDERQEKIMRAASIGKYFPSFCLNFKCLLT